MFHGRVAVVVLPPHRSRACHGSLISTAASCPKNSNSGKTRGRTPVKQFWNMSSFSRRRFLGAAAQSLPPLADQRRSFRWRVSARTISQARDLLRGLQVAEVRSLSRFVTIAEQRPHRATAQRSAGGADRRP